MRLLKATGNNTTQRIYLRGDKRHPEPEEVYIHVPGGSIGACRCSDGSYWVHIALEETDENGAPQKVSGFLDARVDCRNLHASEMDIGHMNRPDAYHVAVRFKK